MVITISCDFKIKFVLIGFYVMYKYFKFPTVNDNNKLAVKVPHYNKHYCICKYYYFTLW